MRYVFISFLLLGFFTVNSQVHLQTGAAEFTLPLYTYDNMNSRLSTSISLNYSGGNGIQVASVASSIGTGWDLQCGGSITRIQMGEPDDQIQNGSFNYPLTEDTKFTPQENNNYFNYLNNYYPKGFLTSEYSPLDNINQNGGYQPLFKRKQVYKQAPAIIADRLQDIFIFSFAGRTGKFVIGKNNAGVKTLEASELQITPNNSDMSSMGIRTNISSFEILDEGGTKYVFDQIQKNEVIEYDDGYEYLVTNSSGTVSTHIEHVPDYLNTEGHKCPILLKGRGTGKYTINKWYLSKIENPLTGEKITFHYEDVTNVDYDGSIAYQFSHPVGQVTGHAQVTQEKTKGFDKQLVRIDCSRKEQIYFEYSTVNRIDLAFDKSLRAIQVKYDGIEKYRWKFDYGYFVQGQIKDAANISTEENFWARLCLKSLERYGIGDLSDSKYSFTYYVDPANIAPPRASIYQDHWGYYNNYHYSASAEVYHEFDDSHDPYSIMAYNPYKDFLQNASNRRAPAIGFAKSGLLKSINYPTGGVMEYEYEQNTSKNLKNPAIQVVMGGVRVKKTIVHDGSNLSNAQVVEYNYNEPNGITSGWGYEEPIYSRTSWVLFEPKDEFSKPGMIRKAVTGSILPFRGRLKMDPLIEPWTVFQEPPGYILFMISYFMSLLAPVSETTVNTISYNSNRLNHNTIPFQYEKVEVANKSLNNSVGTVLYEFTSLKDYPLFVQQQEFPYSSKQRFGDGIYGLLKSVTYKDNNGNTVKFVENRYPLPNALYKPTEVLSNNNYASKMWGPENSHFGIGWQSGTNYAQIQEDLYYPLISKMRLDESKEYTYNDNLQSILSSTSFFYNSNFQLEHTEKYNSKNEKLSTYFYYPENYTLSGAIQTMKGKHILNVPIATQTLITRNGNTYALSGNVTEFGIIANGDVKPVKSYKFQSAQPVAAGNVSFSGSSLLPSTQYYNEQQEIKYNLAGLPESTISLNQKSGKLFGYDNKLVIADIANASGSEAFYDSFEEGGIWNGVGYDNTKVHTGKFSGKIDNLTETTKSCTSNKWLNISLTQDTKFKFSGWVYSDHPDAYIVLRMQTATGQNYSDFAFSMTMERNKWIYLEKECTVPSNITRLSMRIDNRGALDLADYGGTVWFDDIRLHPSNAWMTTYTYDPLIGLTSQTDADNHRVFNEYDGLGRLVHVMDDKGNILKRYCYNSAGQPESCPALTVGNIPMSIVFQKNNCETVTGNYGAQVTYTVPANTYYGATQAEANALTQAVLNNEGQAFANINGGCLAGVPSDLRSVTFTRNNCLFGATGEQLTYTVPAGKYAAATKAAANQLADADVNTNGQAYANAKGSCLFYNTTISGNYYSRGCAANQTPVAYFVNIPAGSVSTYSSVSDANSLAQIEAQRQADLNGQCSNTTTTIYARLEVEPSYSDNTTYTAWDGTTDYNYYQQVAVYLRFYSDAGCTQTLAIPKTVNYGVNNSGYIEYMDSYDYHTGVVAFQGTAPVGTREILFDNVMYFESFWLRTDSDGNWLYYEKVKEDYELGQSNDYIVRPPIYPAHSQGY